MNKKLHRD